MEIFIGANIPGEASLDLLLKIVDYGESGKIGWFGEG